MAQVLVVGSGGREHEICKKFQESPQVTTVFCAPGNPGMRLDGIECVPLDVLDFKGLIQFAEDQRIELTFVGPEGPLSHGIVDAFEAAGLPIFGPKKASAQLESSKSFAKDFMKRHGIPTASSETFTDSVQALSYMIQQPTPMVIKVDGLAAGKGVAIAQTKQEAQDVLEGLYAQDPEQTVVIEDYMVGQECSFMCFINGQTIVPLPLSQDHKRLKDGDGGLNTGGMGAYSPLPQVPKDLMQQAYETIVEPTVQGMVADGLDSACVLYVGLMLTKTGGIKVIEYNMRLGDPETQVLLPRLESDFYQLIKTLLAGDKPTVRWATHGYTLGVVIAAEGYPKKPIQGIPIPEFASNEAIQITYAGVSEQGRHLVSAGGRVLMLTTTQDSIQACRDVLYPYIETHIKAPLIYRHDIGIKALPK